MKVYSANEVSFSFSLIPIDSGRGDNEFVSYDQKEENFTYKAGVDGEGTRSESKNRYTEVKLTLMQTSSGNAVLSAIHNGDILIPGGAGVAPILIRDRQGLDVFASPQAWITKPPERKYAKEADTVEWTFGVDNPVRFDGGHA